MILQVASASLCIPVEAGISFRRSVIRDCDGISGVETPDECRDDRSNDVFRLAARQLSTDEPILRARDVIVDERVE